jgi:hypothetical protein
MNIVLLIIGNTASSRGAAARLVRSVGGVLTLLLSVLVTACGSGSEGSVTETAQVRVLSSDAETVSGDTALVEVTVGSTDTGGRAKTLNLWLNGADISSALKADATQMGRYVGVVSGLNTGVNDLEAGYGSARARLAITAYPLGGPIFSGPHQNPFICQTAGFALPDNSSLGSPTDADCNVAPRVNYLYLPAGTAVLVPLPSLTALPANIATTTTSAGVTMPFVVRVETRVVNRGIYQSAVLHDPTAEAAPTPLSPPKGWNKRLIATQGVGCAPGWYVQGTTQSGVNSVFDVRLLSPPRLGEGFALFANTQMHAQVNCNPLLVSETAMMSKEQFVKSYGVPDFTISFGCSGGSYNALQSADRIPGLYDAVIVACVFPDGLTSSLNGTDARLLSHYWAVTDPSGFTAAQINAVTGYQGLQALQAAAVQSSRVDPVPNRVDISGYNSAMWSSAVPVGLRYDPIANRTGARPTVYDTARNIFGVDATTGFALSPYDNVGVQYGLAALNGGVISVDQFLNLNAAVGGVDADANYTAARSRGDAGAITRAYEAGMVLNGGGGLASVPVFDLTGIYAEDSNYHQQWQHFAVRERLRKANGDAGNFVMWRGLSAPADRAWALALQWAAAVKADTAAGTQREKVLRNKPADAVEGCWNGSTFIAEAQTVSTAADSTCNTLMPTWVFPRRVAGQPLTADIVKCALKTPVRGDYAVSFTDAQWQRLQTIFAQGVCDWTQSGVGQTGLVAKASFGPSPLRRVY